MTKPTDAPELDYQSLDPKEVHKYIAVPKDEYEKLKEELAQEKNYSGETNARLDEAWERVIKLEMENERLKKICREHYGPAGFVHVGKLFDKIKMLTEALEFYGDEKKYFTRKKKINLQKTTAVFHVDDPAKLPTDYESEILECSAAIKVDQGKRARETLKKVRER